MGNDKFLKLCKEKVVEYFNTRSDKTDSVFIDEEEVFVVWSCKTLQNNKALLSTTISDGMYYELTYNGDKNELYFDAYKKWQNICHKLQEETNMKFEQALQEMKKGIPMKLPSWGGYWCWDEEKKTIIMYTKDNERLDIR